MEEEHEMYGREIPGEVDSVVDVESSNTVGEMKKRLKAMEEEAAALREIQAKVEKEMSAIRGLHPRAILVAYGAGTSASEASKEEVDSRSVYVGNKQVHPPRRFNPFLRPSVGRAFMAPQRFSAPYGYGRKAPGFKSSSMRPYCSRKAPGFKSSSMRYRPF
ncbi:hypothetical protein B296_00016550 [Ensete ventricosum]|uniref:Polyadenylate-binding protein 2 n=1 Tax=Ensete ventricosum TaxID=4639 RepID=A0A426XRY5_ENSVE|nr:hypothetical protein B296_00016550 [Ensete ventricosum]